MIAIQQNFGLLQADFVWWRTQVLMAKGALSSSGIQRGLGVGHPNARWPSGRLAWAKATTCAYHGINSSLL